MTLPSSASIAGGEGVGPIAPRSRTWSPLKGRGNVWKSQREIWTVGIWANNKFAQVCFRCGTIWTVHLPRSDVNETLYIKSWIHKVEYDCTTGPPVLLVWIEQLCWVEIISWFTFFGWFQTSKTGGQPYSDTCSYEVSEYCLLCKWLTVNGHFNES